MARGGGAGGGREKLHRRHVAAGAAAAAATAAAAGAPSCRMQASVFREVIKPPPLRWRQATPPAAVAAAPSRRLRVLWERTPARRPPRIQRRHDPLFETSKRTSPTGTSEPYSGHLQPFSQKSRTAAVPNLFQIGLCGVVEADMELFRDSWSVGFLGERR